MIDYIVGVICVIVGVWFLYDVLKNPDKGTVGAAFNIRYFATGLLGILLGILIIKESLISKMIHDNNTGKEINLKHEK